MKYRTLNQTEKNALVGAKCFLNEKPAYIYGRLNQFATIAQAGGPLAVEWAWETVKRVMDNNQEFST
jgi:hypothetical protein